MSGKRYNKGKVRYSLIHFPTLEGMIRVLESGTEKYDDFNWQNGLKVRGIAESLMRHLAAYLEGVDMDSESGLPHVDHIQCNAHFLSYMSKFPEMDDRNKGGLHNKK